MSETGFISSILQTALSIHYSLFEGTVFEEGKHKELTLRLTYWLSVRDLPFPLPENRVL